MNAPYLCTSVARELQRSPIPTIEKIIEKAVSQKNSSFRYLIWYKQCKVAMMVLSLLP